MGTNFYAVSIACLKIGILHEWLRIFTPRGSRNWFWVRASSWAAAQR